MNHPIQPLEMVNGVLRFKENRIVQHLVSFGQAHGCDLNTLAVLGFSREATNTHHPSVVVAHCFSPSNSSNWPHLPQHTGRCWCTRK